MAGWAIVNAMASTPVSDSLRKMGSLTKRQREVLALAAEGMTNPEIGDLLGISKDGAKWHIGEILMRLDVDTREEAVDLWRRYNGMPYRLHRVMGTAPGPVALRWVVGTIAATAVAGLGTILVVAAVQQHEDNSQKALSAATKSTSSVAARTAEATSSSLDPRTIPLATGATVVAGHEGVYKQALADLQEYLNIWARSGQRAANEFVAPEQQLPEDAVQLVLLGGRVTSYAPSHWDSDDRLTLLVNLQLHFKRGDGGAFGEGQNSRFITFTRASPSARFVMSFATSP